MPSSHLSCYRRSPRDRRQFSTWAMTKDSKHAAITGRIASSTAASHAERPDGSSTAATAPAGIKADLAPEGRAQHHGVGGPEEAGAGGTDRP